MLIISQKKKWKPMQLVENCGGMNLCQNVHVKNAAPTGGEEWGINFQELIFGGDDETVQCGRKSDVAGRLEGEREKRLEVREGERP
jgi:hypothetical protein